MSSALTSVPIIDLAIPEEEAALQVHKACVDYGFLYVKGHGVPAGLTASLFDIQHKFFNLPLTKKREILFNEDTRGYTPMGDWMLDAGHSSQPDTHEGLYFGREVSAESEDAKLPFHGPNLWPDEDLVPGYRSLTEQYFQALTVPALRMLRLLGLALGLGADYFTPFFQSPYLTLRPLHYSAAKSAPDEGSFGIGAHTDFGVLTFLVTDGGPGLQICLDKNKKEWLDVPPIDGAYIVNIGDLLERWTNGLYRSTLHRVINTTGQERYSMPFFIDPDFHAVIEPVPSCCSEANPAKFPPIMAGQHFLTQFAASYIGRGPRWDRHPGQKE